MIKADLKEIVVAFFAGKVDIARLNYGIISLLSKGKDADRIQKYRPICLLNVSYKILTKVLTNRLAKIIDRVVLLSQFAFLKGRYIMDGVLILHETLHVLHRRKQPGILFKVDFQKVYDKVK